MNGTADDDDNGLTERDRWHRDVMRELLLKSNGVIIDYAKQMIALTFAAVGVVTALAELGQYRDHLLVALLCAGYLFAAGTFVSVVFPRDSTLSPNDYSDASARVERLARRRRAVALAATWLTGFVTLAAVAFFAFARPAS